MIVWGKRLAHEESGYVGHFCPICRAISLFRVSNLRLVTHVYFIGLGRGELAGTELECTGCHTVLALKRCSGQPRPREGTDLTEFAARTSPLGKEKLFARLEVEKRALKGALSQEERQQLLAEPFLALEYGAQVRQTRGSDRSLQAVIGLLAMIGVIACMCLWGTWSFEHTNISAFRFWTVAVTLATATLIAWAAWLEVSGVKRVARSGKAVSRIAQSLYPLRPTPPEIEQTLALLRHRNFLLGFGLQPGEILAALDKLTQSGPNGQNWFSR